MIESEEAVKHIVALEEKKKQDGMQKQTMYVQIWQGTKTVNGYPARKRKVAIEDGRVYR